MLRGKGGERCTWYMAGNLPGLDRRDDAGLAVDVMELLQEGNRRAKGNKTYHLVISFHPTDRRLSFPELEDVVRRTVDAAGLSEHQYIAVRHSEQEHEHVHVAVNKIHPETLKIHHPYRAIPAYQALATILEQELGLHRVDRARGHARGHRARDFEAHRGIESFSGWARRTIGDIARLDRIASWSALHEELAGFGVRVVRRGNGLAIVDARRPRLACKASTLGRGWSKQRLCERYGDFVPGPQPADVARGQVQPYEERPLGRELDDGLWREYREALDAARRHRGEHREAMASRIRGGPRGARRSLQVEAPRNCRDAHSRAGQAHLVQDAFVREKACRAQADGDHQRVAGSNRRRAPRVLERVSRGAGHPRRPAGSPTSKAPVSWPGDQEP